MRAQDWQSLIDRCFDNREADIGRFVRRHLTGLVGEVQKALGAHGHPGAGVASISQSEWLLKQGRQQFEEAWKEKKKKLVGQEDVVFYGFYEVAVALVNGHVKKIPLVELPEALFVAQPHMTGWPPWVDSRHFVDQRLRPYVRKGGWEALVRRVQDQWAQGAIDFWRIEPAGNFYMLRTYENDTSQTLLRRGIEPGKVFDFLLLIARTAEVIETAKNFGAVIAEDKKQGSLLFTFRWSGLRQRELCCWVEPARDGVTGLRPQDDEVVAHLLMPLDTPTNLIWEKVKMATQAVFDIFGVGLPDSVFQEIVTETVQRRT